MTFDPDAGAATADEGRPSTAGPDSNPAEHGVEELYLAWQERLRALTADASLLARWQEHRYRFAHRVRVALLGATAAGSGGVVGPVVYGIYTAAGLCYVGQTAEAQRRLGDLPVGERHHVGNTLPPELWERVVVLRWPALLATVPAAERAAVQEMGDEVCGLTLEHALQVATAPLLNLRRRGRGGEWRVRNLAGSGSRGAVHAGIVPRLCEVALAAWQDLASARIPDGDVVMDVPAGRIVLPSRISRAAP
ncbi:hypothetical protein ABZ341_35720 [Streptomyces sp. NPDC006173]|uniref:hypothetical protein n=1 Tax=Streptomyces sp. NPDC006173 TaxID=3155349 RepID=UPI0033F85AA7